VPHGIPQCCLECGFVGLIRDDRSEIGQIELSGMLIVQVGRGSSAVDTISLLFGNLRYQQAPIEAIPFGSELHQSVAQQFTSQWKHPTRVPFVRQVYKINMGRSVLNRFTTYQRRVALRTGIPDGNTRRRFHGTKRECRLGEDDEETALCSIRSCNLCRVIQRSFEITRAGENTNFGRFGVGIYTSATSSKANDYSTSTTGLFKAMLLNDVVMGNAIKLTWTDTSLTKPPQRYDSVVGEPQAGGDLNYDEAVVYDQDAICPSFLLIHSR